MDTIIVCIGRLQKKTKKSKFHIYLRYQKKKNQHLILYLYELCHTIYKVLNQECEKQKRKSNLKKSKIKMSVF